MTTRNTSSNYQGRHDADEWQAVVQALLLVAEHDEANGSLEWP
jgi:hypothetical protein